MRPRFNFNPARTISVTTPVSKIMNPSSLKSQLKTIQEEFTMMKKKFMKRMTVSGVFLNDYMI